jgi:hypothetical protein
MIDYGGLMFSQGFDFLERWFQIDLFYRFFNVLDLRTPVADSLVHLSLIV